MFTGTSTTLIFAQEPDLNPLKDCNNHPVNHEMVPITMNNPRLPEVLEHAIKIPQIPDEPFINLNVQSNLNTRVYTLREESEIESDNNLT